LIGKSRLRMNYTHLTHEERYQIHELLTAKVSQVAIARILGRSASSICRELQRNWGHRGYRPRQAHEMAEARRSACQNGRQITPEVWAHVEERLRLDHSPEQVSEVLKAEGLGQVSHERIYQMIYADKAEGGQLHSHLRCQKPRRKRYGSGRQRRGQIPNRRGIELRPLVVETRSRVGDWEADTVLGTQASVALVTLTERTTRFELVAKVECRTANQVRDAIIEMLLPFSAFVHTITFDNGKEFSGHEAIAEALNADCFFADAYSSWQRGLNENTNGLLRQYFPKGESLDRFTDEDIEFAVNRLNTRPRKCLDWQTPQQAFHAAARKQGVALRT
jgi:IS30 family transposase